MTKLMGSKGLEVVRGPDWVVRQNAGRSWAARPSC